MEDDEAKGAADRASENQTPATSGTTSPSQETKGVGTPDQTPLNINHKIIDPEKKAIWYKPQYSPDGLWIWDLENKQWVRSSKPIPPKAKPAGHWETRTFQYKVCNGRGSCHWETGSKSVWVADAPTQPKQTAKLKSKYPIRSGWWTGMSSYKHLLTGIHAGNFNENWLKSLSYEELQSLHSDHHEGKVKWHYVNQ